MEHCFISGAPQLLDTWRDAFGASAVLQAPSMSHRRSNHCLYWLDWDSLSRDTAQTQLQYLLAAGLRVVVMSTHPEAGDGMRLFGRGVRGYCHQRAVASQLREIALVIDHGGVWVGADAMTRLLQGTLNLIPREADGKAASLLARLTGKEREVAGEVARGASNREIAENLAMSERTVKFHLSAIFEKLQVRDRVQLALLLNNVLLR